jgi:hypothetical protein
MRREFTELKISLNEAGNGLIFAVKAMPYSVKLPFVPFPADVRDEIATGAKIFFGGEGADVSTIQEPLAKVTAEITEYLLKIKSERLRLDIDDILKDVPWELAKVEQSNSTWGRYFCAVRLAKGFNPNPNRTGESWRVFYDPEILTGDGLAYYRAVGCGRDEVDVSDGGAKDAFESSIADNNIIQIASHCEPVGDRLTLTNTGGEFLDSQNSHINSSPRMVILDCCHSAETPLFSFRDFFREGCAVFIGHLGKMRVFDGHGSRFTKLFTRAFMIEKKSLADSVKDARDTDKLRDYSAVVYVWEGVRANFTKNEVFGITDERKKGSKRRLFVAAAAVLILVVGAIVISPEFLPQDNKNTPQADDADATVSNAENPTPADGAGATETHVAPSFSNVTYTSGAHVTGKVANVAPNEYGVVLMILVGDGEEAQFYIKPNLREGVCDINPDGSFDIQAYTDDGAAKENDLTATMYSVFLVPKSFKSSELTGASDYETVKSNATAAVEKQNITRSNP